MKYIGFGDVNKKLLYILLGGIGKLIAELILYFYGKDVKMTKHCFILGINAGMGMLLAFIPHVIVKVKSKKTFYTYFMLCFRLFSKNFDFFL